MERQSQDWMRTNQMLNKPLSYWQSFYLLSFFFCYIIIIFIFLCYFFCVCSQKFKNCLFLCCQPSYKCVIFVVIIVNFFYYHYLFICLFCLLLFFFVLWEKKKLIKIYYWMRRLKKNTSLLLIVSIDVLYPLFPSNCSKVSNMIFELCFIVCLNKKRLAIPIGHPTHK